MIITAVTATLMKDEQIRQNFEYESQGVSLFINDSLLRTIYQMHNKFLFIIVLVIYRVGSPLKNRRIFDDVQFTLPDTMTKHGFSQIGATAAIHDEIESDTA